MKGDSASATALEVILSINTLIRLLGELRTSNDTTGGMAVFTQNAPLPLVEVALAWGLAGAEGGRSTLSVAFRIGGLANTLPAVGSVTVDAGEATRVVLGTNRGRMVRASTVASLRRYQVGEEARDLRGTNDQGSRDKDRVGLDKGRNLRKTHARPEFPKVDRFPSERVRERARGIEISTDVQPCSLLGGRAGEGLGTSEQSYQGEEHTHDLELGERSATEMPGR
jgi:hypothetical protein